MEMNMTEKALRRWQNNLSEEGRLDELQESKDEELAQRYAPLTAAFFAEERAKIEGRPTLSGITIGKIAAAPRKRVLRDSAKDFDKFQAILEIVDNIIDNYLQCRRSGYRTAPLDIKLEMWGREVQIRENSGGIKPASLEAFVTLGLGGEGKGVGTIGAWGQALKYSFYALGTDTIVTSKFWKNEKYLVSDHPTDSIGLRLDRNWYMDEREWDVPAYVPAKDMPAGETHYSIQNLHEEFDENDIVELRQRLGETFGDLIVAQEEVGNPIHIIVKGEKVEPQPFLADEAILRDYAFPPNFEPIWVEESWTRNVDGEDVTLRAKALVGLMPRAKQDDCGVFMFGNPGVGDMKVGPRLFATRLQTEEVGYGTHGNSLLRRGDPTIGRLRVYVVFYGGSKIIPWGAPLKWEYRKTTPFQTDIKNFMYTILRPYATVTKVATEFDIVPFSNEWNEMSETSRVNLIRKAARVSEQDQEVVADIWKQLPEQLVAKKDALPPVKEVKAEEFEAVRSTTLAKAVASTIRARQAALQKPNTDGARVILEFTEKVYKAAPEDGESTGLVMEVMENEDPLDTITVKVRRSQWAVLCELTGKNGKSDVMKDVIEFFITAQQKKE